MKKRAGFTLIEMLVVIVIIVLLAAGVVASWNSINRATGVRGGAPLLIQAIAKGKQLSANQRVVHFLVMGNDADGGWIQIHIDANGDGKFQGDNDHSTPDPDPAIEQNLIQLPKNCLFMVIGNVKKYPDWMGFNPSGYIIFPPGFQEVQAGTFDGMMASSAPTAIGDIILEAKGKDMKL
ncbi:MAG: prepilin-type N-terminal cleavage/methylation domain-containing protein, partial [SAR324 cluster bacterium]|nr:prepilin-type N-terminal cleavage/methylation domain-containing protein [SAR324 cluster bacterium]